MRTINIDDGIYNEIKAIISDRRIDYPTIKNFIEKACRGLILSEMAKEKEGEKDGERIS